MTDIFISYKNEDSERVRNIADALSQLGYDVWWDQRIPLGQTYRSAIGEVLSTAKCVIVVWSYDAIEAQWVLDEADEGKTRGVLLPILIDPVDPPFGFRQIETARLIDWSGQIDHEEWQHVVEAIASLVGCRGHKTPLSMPYLPEPLPHQSMPEAPLEGLNRRGQQSTHVRRSMRAPILAALLFVGIGLGGWWGGRDLVDRMNAYFAVNQTPVHPAEPTINERPTLVRVHISGEAQRNQADALIAVLERAGYTVRGAELVGAQAPRVAEIRGYRAEAHAYLRQIDVDLSHAGITGFTTRILPAQGDLASDTLDIYFPIISAE